MRSFINGFDVSYTYNGSSDEWIIVLNKNGEQIKHWVQTGREGDIRLTIDIIRETISCVDMYMPCVAYLGDDGKFMHAPGVEPPNDEHVIFLTDYMSMKKILYHINKLLDYENKIKELKGCEKWYPVKIRDELDKWKNVLKDNLPKYLFDKIK